MKDLRRHKSHRSHSAISRVGFLILSFSALPSLALEKYHPVDSFIQGTIDIPDRDNAVILTIGTVLTMSALAFDDSIKEYFAGKERLGSASQIGSKYIGSGIPGILIGLGSLSYGLIRASEHSLDSGEAHLEALLASFLYTDLLKLVFQRERPDKGDQFSFPSGHSSITFTTASVLWYREGALAGTFALALASFTGLCRLADNRHHLSDVLFGATLGWVVGRAYTLHHQDKNIAKTKNSFFLIPYFDSYEAFGLNAQLRF